MPPPYNGIAEVRIVGDIENQDTVNVLRFGTNEAQYDGANPFGSLEDLAIAVTSCVRDTLLGALPAAWRLVKVDVRQLYPTLSDTFEQGALSTDVGELGDSDVTFASQLLSLRTGGGGRKGKGRVFLPPPPEGGVHASKLTAPQLALLAAFVACMAGKFIGAGASTEWRWVVLSRVGLNANYSNANDHVREVQTVLVRDVVAVMRRRRIGKGS